MKWLLILILIIPGIVQAQKKNVLFIAIDDLKPLITKYDNKSVQTPNIDRLASLGTTFLNANCQQAVCAPSRASFLTGLYPDKTKVWDLQTIIRDNLPLVITLPQTFRNNGYITTGAGKIFDPRSVDSQFDSVSWSQSFTMRYESKYFDHTKSNYRGYYNPLVEHDWLAYQSYLTTNNITSNSDKVKAMKLFPYAHPSYDSANLPDNAYGDGAMTDYILNLWKELHSSTSPYFLSIGYLKPHLPFKAPKKYWDLHEEKDISIDQFFDRPSDVPDFAWDNNSEVTNQYSDTPLFNGSPFSEAEQKHLIHGYMACVSYVDAQVGKLLSRMDSLNLWDNTIIVLWGDHGWHLGDHNLWAKATNFEQAVRAPLIIVDPDLPNKGQTISSPVEFVDVYPTLCELAGIEPPSGLDGQSMVTLMKNPNVKFRKTAMAQYPRIDHGKDVMGYTLRSENYRYTKWVEMDYKSGIFYGEPVGYQLYDMINDPHETTNLIGNSEYDSIVSFFEMDFKKRNVAQTTPSSYLELTTCDTSYRAPDGQLFFKSGIYSDTLTAMNGLDSIITINLTLKGFKANIINDHSSFLKASIDNASYRWMNCDSQAFINGATEQIFAPRNSGSYAVEITKNACTKLSSCTDFLLPDTTTINITTCDSLYTGPDGQEYNQSGRYIFKLTNNNRDSTVILNLFIDYFGVDIFREGTTFTTSIQNADAYQWINCDTGDTIPSETTQLFQPSSLANYAVIVTKGKCSIASKCMQAEVDQILQTQNLKTLKCYPNPVTNNLLFIELPQDTNRSKIEFLDLNGKVLEVYPFSNQHKLTITTNLTSGTYIIRINTEQKVFHKKVIIE